ncbi:MAG TPA: outer membrane protein assembly factor BamA [Anaerohalosphaeraceae bacterium]|nr:outer membrane protein assembly factor BamA [Phycisphaerae bacterium]HOL30999.1 outer membrane protein assembly factor BamA [Anaerohalosphaeraceae bacterium]HOM76101.1 outer membrane protein assembly factor BamA [Anaerohalosphaeraceae bacterium]HPC63356.1 outer membrane protein assembly factor BamA [Anaerohalosphaeraceae bacterium]HPO69093.1 outer membrane protein assembly factor BamA [Anaerohalosphaeraceae bacterium]
MRQLRSQAAVLLAVCICAGLAGAQDSALSPEGLTIKSLEVAGNVTLTRAEILAVVRSRSGLPFRAETAAEDMRRIGRLEAVERVYYNTRIENGTVVLTYVVEERNLVRSLALVGNKKLKDAVLLKELGFHTGDYLDVFLVRAGADAMEALYRKKGFPWAKVTVSEEGLLLGQVTYQIEEGPRPKIAHVEYNGNQMLRDGQLSDVVKTKPRKFLFFPVYYTPEQVEQDTQKLLEAYHKKSFLDAQISNKVVFNETKSRAYVTFDVAEGPAYTVNAIRLSGNEFFSSEQLSGNMKLRQNYFYSEAWADFDAKKIKSTYGQQGFIDAQVDAKRTILPEARVDVDYEIKEGSRYRIGEVTVVGNTTLQDRTIRRIMDEEGFTPGQWYNADIARGNGEGELEKIIRQSVVAEAASIVPTGTDPNTRDALVTIREGQTGSIMLGAGIASDSGVIGSISLTQRNFDITDWPESWSELFTGKAFRGAGQQFRLTASPGTEVSTYSVSFTEPYLFDMPMALNLVGSSFERWRETYDESRLTGRFGLEKRYADDWRRGLSFRLEDVKIENLDWDAPQDVIDVKGSNMLYGTRLYIRKDTTDSRFTPSRGYNFDAGYEQVFGDHTFGILDGTYRWYTTLYEDLAELKTVLETKITAATTVGNAPTFERFYLGGQSSLRGFEYRGVSPRSGPSKEPIGSDWMVVGNAEVAVPLGSQMFSWLFFTDAGLIDDGNVRSSVGTGIQILIPQFFGPVPMRFELAAPITKDQDDDTQVFSFSVGALF